MQPRGQARADRGVLLMMRRAMLALLALATGCASIAGLDLNGFHPRQRDAGRAGQSGTSGSGSGGDASASGGASGSAGSAGSAGSGGSSGTGGTSGSGGTGGTGGSAGFDGGAGASGSGGAGGTTDSDAGFTTTARSCGTTGKGLTDCGPTHESCCKSERVTGGTFYRGYDGVSNPDKSHKATVSSFRLDKYEVTVARFRQFVTACDSTNWHPGAGDGKHTYLHNGNGLVAGSSANTYESGWKTAWNPEIPATKTDWDNTLECASGTQTWTPDPGNDERRPINCVTWYEAYAFCIWDGGFLPSDAEWNYAASGGGEQRVYPWSSPPDSATIDCSYANYSPGSPCYGGKPNDVGSESPLGSGLWGNEDLAGNVAEWNLDFNDPYPGSCGDCAGLAPTSTRVYRGGSYSGAEWDLYAAAPYFGSPTTRFDVVGIRCARAP